MPRPLQLVLRVALGAGLTVGLGAFGLYVTGQTARASSWVRGGPEVELEPLGGSTGSPAVVDVHGEPTRVQTCRVPHLAPSTVLARYARQAGAETPAGAPHLVQEHPGGGGAVVWVDASGRRKGVLVEADPRGGTRYRLLESEPPRGRVAPGLPGGLRAPPGAELVTSTVDASGQGLALLGATGDPTGVARRFLDALEDQGLRRAPGEALPTGGRGRIALQLTGGGQRGVLVVAPAGAGRCRVSLSLRRD